MLWYVAHKLSFQNNFGIIYLDKVFNVHHLTLWGLRASDSGCFDLNLTLAATMFNIAITFVQNLPLWLLCLWAASYVVWQTPLFLNICKVSHLSRVSIISPSCATITHYFDLLDSCTGNIVLIFLMKRLRSLNQRLWTTLIDTQRHYGLCRLKISIIKLIADYFIGQLLLLYDHLLFLFSRWSYRFNYLLWIYFLFAISCFSSFFTIIIWDCSLATVIVIMIVDIGAFLVVWT